MRHSGQREARDTSQYSGGHATTCGGRDTMQHFGRSEDRRTSRCSGQHNSRGKSPATKAHTLSEFKDDALVDGLAKPLQR